MAQFLRGPVKLPIWQDQRGGEIVVKSDATDFRGFGATETGAGQHSVHGCSRMKLGDLKRKLKTAGRCCHVGTERQRFAGRIEMPDQSARRLRSGDMDTEAAA
ncbi:hypothetical protein D3C80_1542270 [compost metagenome]